MSNPDRAELIRKSSYMLFFGRKTRKPQSTSGWDNNKWLYEEAVRNCYGRNVILAICSSKRFIGFNCDGGFGSRLPFVEDSITMNGVVHEPSQGMRHVPCVVSIVDRQRQSDDVGNLMLTHLLDYTGATARPEEKALELNVTLYDAPADLRRCLQDCLRDAALSGYSFMHVQLGCLEAGPDEAESALAQMREKGYGPMRQIVEIKLWPSVELQHSPKWARPSY